MIAYSVDGTALANPARWLREQGVDDALAAPRWRGNDQFLPGIAGEMPLARVRDVDFDEFIVSITGDLTSAGAAVVGEDARAAQCVTNIRDLQALLIPAAGGTIQVTKTLTTAAGPVVQGPKTCRCVSSLAPRFEGPTFARVLVRLKVYEGWT